MSAFLASIDLPAICTTIVVAWVAWELGWVIREEISLHDT